MIIARAFILHYTGKRCILDLSYLLVKDITDLAI